jgi:hypothetical protein
MSNRLKQSEQSAALLYHARAATPFSSQQGEPCASIPCGVDCRRVLPLRSAEFRDWLTANYYSEYETAPSYDALQATIRTLEARAQYGDSPSQKIDHRVGFAGDPYAPSKIYIDLANEGGEILAVSSRGLGVIDNLKRSFRRSPGMLPLDLPVNHQPFGNHGALRKFSNLFKLADTARTRLLVWLCAALRPVGPYPILVLRGPAASGKTTLARALRALIDPSAAPVRRLPAREQDLLQLAVQNWVLAFDYVHRAPIQICEALCAIASGEVIETAQPDYREKTVAEVARPIILIASVDGDEAPWTPIRSLANRTLTIDLPAITVPRSEAAMATDLEALRAPVLAALADAVSSALGNIRDIDLGNIARFSDCAAWAAAAAPVLHLERDAIVEAVSNPESMWLGTDPLRDTLYTMLASRSAWSGNPATLLAELRRIAPLATLPSNPKALDQALARIPGIAVSRDRRGLKISRVTAQIQYAGEPLNPTA